MSQAVSDVNARVKATWEAGNWDVVSSYIATVGPRLIERAGVVEGMEMLDVGTGSGGTVAVPAALRGARVTGADITGAWFGPARARAEAAGVEVDWVVADAEDMPFEDGRFDRVLSTFGHMFAPHHAAAAAEMARVCKPGGLIATATWEPKGPNGEMFKLLGSKMPPPPEGVSPPPMWGLEEHAREMWEPHGLELEFSIESVAFENESEDEFVKMFTENFGPMVMAKGFLGDGFDAVLGEYREILRRHNTAPDGRMRIEPTYLVTIARKPG